ncbi:phosphoribosylglycinamide formyltransferase [Polluticoccus soli]|uniref:phosphoribosylglycinamide formyltransferase n=1 Tax=Polluticoccus soli TaxID=3034150 RepID=UPI0023E2E740|nr:phosphoribosylglycinamide formyltransferase [Flavipsychrobacter sp. JY13-12]
MHNLVIFASGTGTNAQAIIDYFKTTGIAKVSLIVSNKAEAGVLNIARNENIPSIVIDRQRFNDPELIDEIKSHTPALIVLAGFLWKIPDALVAAFPNKIVNIHPALLPKFGGKGMYGHHVHNAVLEAGDMESGITIHYVNEVYDSGNVIVQARCLVNKGESAGDLAGRIHKLEHFFFPRTIEFLLANAGK